MFKIVVLMSTYNGEMYLREQIDTILSQTMKVDLIVRDDGSQDKTQIILEEYKKKGKLNWYKGKNIGFVESFLELLRNAPNADYYAFADQDDYWEKNKIEIAVNKIKDEKVPCLYCSNLKVVDKNLVEKGYYFRKNFLNIKLDTILLDNIAAGCTMVFNLKLAKVINRYIPIGILYHDWWICLLAIIEGKVVYDNSSYIKYRQHSSNVVGFKEKKHDLKWLKNKFIEIMEKKEWSNLTKIFCREILNGYKSELTEKQIILLEDILNYNNNYISRIRLIFNKDFSVGTISGNFYRRLLILLGKN